MAPEYLFAERLTLGGIHIYWPICGNYASISLRNGSSTHLLSISETIVLIQHLSAAAQP
jgi:hypothetical protein